MKTTTFIFGTLLAFGLASCTNSEETSAASESAASESAASESAASESAASESGASESGASESGGTTQAVEGEPAAAGGGISTSGSLEQGDSLYGEDNSFYDEYKINAEAGDTIAVSMESSDFDAFLHLMGPGDLHEMNDDHGDDDTTNSRITYVATAAGEYTIYANSLYAPEECAPAAAGGEPTCQFSGAYTLTATAGQ
jgi:hypothetical protein